MPLMADEHVTVKPAPTADFLASLVHLKQLLHLAHYRNRNQHRRAASYRYFQMFKRHLGTIVALYTEIARVPDTHAGRHRKKAVDKASVAKIQTEVDFLAQVMIPKCAHAFSQLVADLRFSVLGIVLVAILAQSCRLLGITGWYEAMAEKDIQEVLERFEREEYGTSAGNQLPDVGDEDFGEVIRRDGEDAGMQIDPVLSLSTQESQKASPVGVKRKAVAHESLPALHRKQPPTPELKRPPTAAETPTRPKKKKKTARKSTGDALDDLFAGL